MLGSRNELGILHLVFGSFTFFASGDQVPVEGLDPAPEMVCCKKPPDEESRDQVKAGTATFEIVGISRLRDGQIEESRDNRHHYQAGV